MERPVHFEIHATDVERAKTFYEAVFGWRITQWGGQPYWTIRTGDGDPMAGIPATEPGIDGGLLPRDGGAPDPGQPMTGFVVTVGVASCDETIQKALEAGASIVFPKAPVPQVGWLAYLTDPEGNRFGVLEPDASAI